MSYISRTTSTTMRNGKLHLENMKVLVTLKYDPRWLFSASGPYGLNNLLLQHASGPVEYSIILRTLMKMYLETMSGERYRDLCRSDALYPFYPKVSFCTGFLSTMLSLLRSAFYRSQSRNCTNWLQGRKTLTTGWTLI